MTKVYIWRCEEHGKMEFTQEPEKVHCPFCGKEMTFTGDTYEEASPKVVKRKQKRTDSCYCVYVSGTWQTRSTR